MDAIPLRVHTGYVFDELIILEVLKLLSMSDEGSMVWFGEKKLSWIFKWARTKGSLFVTKSNSLIDRDEATLL
jgi:hypothetical protein